MNLPNPVAIRPEDFLRSALFVDDLASLGADMEDEIFEASDYDAELDDDLEVDLDTGLGTPPIDEAADTQGVSTDRENHRQADLVDAIALVNAFAELGIACATLRPQSPTGDDRSRILRLARGTDIVIIDWVLRPSPPVAASPPVGLGTDETTSRRLIGEIVHNDEESGGRLRVICVYTGDPDLNGIRDQIADELNERNIHGVELTRSGVIGPNFLVMVVAKPRNTIQGPEQFSESDLAEHLVEKFASFASGLLRQAALVGLAAVRNNAHRILLRFTPTADPAFLSHRALVGQTDAREYAVWLIGQELSATAVAAAMEAGVTDRAVENQVDLLLPADSADRKLLVRANEEGLASVSAAVGRRLLLEGSDAEIATAHLNGADIENAASVTSLLFEGADPDVLRESQASDEEFAVISCLELDPRLQDPTRPAPILELGTLLHSSETNEYFLCVQPSCDSVRLRRATTFPLLPLQIARGKTPWDITVPSPTEPDRYVRLSSLHGKLHKLKMATFTPSSLVVRPRRDQEGAFWVLDGELNGAIAQFRWIGHLRRDQAARCAMLLSHSAARIGVSESEFQRVRASRR